MWYRLASVVACTAFLVLGLVGPAHAGGWAVVTLDALPEAGFQADTTYRMGYTIRQHGTMPFGDAKTEIRITSPSTGEAAAFVGVPEGPVGHYVAEVRFPSGGSWNWEVTQDPFRPQTLGTVQVAGPTSGSGLGDMGWLRLAAPVAALSAFGLCLLVVARRRSAAPGPHAGSAGGPSSGARPPVGPIGSVPRR